MRISRTILILLLSYAEILLHTCHLWLVARICVFPSSCVCLCTQDSHVLTGTHLSPWRPPLLGLTITRRGWEPGRGLIWRRVINTAQTSIRQEWPEWQWEAGGWHTCSAWPSPRLNLKVWLASSGLVLGGDSPSPRFSIDWRSCKHRCCLHFFFYSPQDAIIKQKKTLHQKKNTNKTHFLSFSQDTWMFIYMWRSNVTYQPSASVGEGCFIIDREIDLDQ